MPLEIIKRHHSRECLADLQKRIMAGTLKIPKTETEHTFLLHYPHCGCAWWVRGTTDHGKSIPVHSLKVYSKAAAEEEVRKLNKPDAPEKLKTSVTGTMEDWIRELRVDETNPATIYAYENSLAKLRTFCAAEKIQWLQDLGPDQLTKMKAQWQEKKYKLWTRRSFMGAIGTFLAWAVMRKKISQNPLALMKRKRRKGEDEEERRTMPLDPDGGDANYRKLLEAIPKWLAVSKEPRRGQMSTRPEHLVALCEVMYETGLRVSDAVLIRPDKIEIVAGRCGTYEAQQKKTKTPVHVYLPLWLAEKLKRLERISTCGKYVFLDDRITLKGFISGEINLKLRQIGKAAGIVGVRPHRFRDTFAVNKLNQGYSIDDVGTLLGHSDPKVTRRFYAPWVKSREVYLMNQLFPAGKVVEMKPKRRAG